MSSPTETSLVKGSSSISLDISLPQVSVLIVCYNELKTIKPLVHALQVQTGAQLISEILIADNGSTDGSFETLKSLSETSELPLTVWQRSQNNIGAARQELVDRAKSEWVVFLDADCTPPPHWLRELVQKAEGCLQIDNDFAGCGGGHHLPENNTVQRAVNALMKYTPLHGFSAQSFDGDDTGRCVDHLPTTNVIFKKSALHEVGGFSKNFSFVGEDLDLGLRLTDRGFNLYRFAKPALENDCATSNLQWAKRMFRFGTAQGLVFGRRGGFTLAFLLLSLVIFTAGLIVPPILFIGGLSLLAVALLFANKVANKTSRDLWSTAFVISALTAPCYFCGFLNGLVKKLRYGY